MGAAVASVASAASVASVASVASAVSASVAVASAASAANAASAASAASVASAAEATRDSATGSAYLSDSMAGRDLAGPVRREREIRCAPVSNSTEEVNGMACERTSCPAVC